MEAERLIQATTGWLLTYLIHSTLLLGATALLSHWLVNQDRVLERLWRVSPRGQGCVSPLIRRNWARARYNGAASIRRTRFKRGMGGPSTCGT